MFHFFKHRNHNYRVKVSAIPHADNPTASVLRARGFRHSNPGVWDFFVMGVPEFRCATLRALIPPRLRRWERPTGQCLQRAIRTFFLK